MQSQEGTYTSYMEAKLLGFEKIRSFYDKDPDFHDNYHATKQASMW